MCIMYKKKRCVRLGLDYNCGSILGVEIEAGFVIVAVFWSLSIGSGYLDCS